MIRQLFVSLLALLLATVPCSAQMRKAQNKPYIDLRLLHYGILLGLNMQDAELRNVGTQQLTLADGSLTDGNVVCDVDIWNPGFSVGVLADLRLGDYFSLRFTPSMHFGSKRLMFRNMNDLDERGRPSLTTQDLKNTYIAFPAGLKFASQRFNNYRPYVMAGLSWMINLAGKDQDYILLKRHDLLLEVGMGCDFYLPFFKLIPELKFGYGLTNALDKGHAAELRDQNKMPFAKSVDDVRTKMVVFTLYFE